MTHPGTPGYQLVRSQIDNRAGTDKPVSGAPLFPVITSLSPAQRRVLALILAEYRRLEAWYGEHPDPRVEANRPQTAYHYEWWGTEIRLTDSSDRVEQASVSRTVRRLEARGLILRRNGVSGDRWEPHGGPVHYRATGYVLTPEGRAVAEALEDSP